MRHVLAFVGSAALVAPWLPSRHAGGHSYASQPTAASRPGPAATRSATRLPANGRRSRRLFGRRGALRDRPGDGHRAHPREARRLPDRSVQSPARGVVLSYVRHHHDALGLTAATSRPSTSTATTSTSTASTTCPGPRAAAARRSSATACRPRSPHRPPADPLRLAGVQGLGAEPRHRKLTTGDRRHLGGPHRQRRDVRLPGPDDTAEPVLFVTGGTSHAAWETITMSAAQPDADRPRRRHRPAALPPAARARPSSSRGTVGRRTSPAPRTAARRARSTTPPRLARRRRQEARRQQLAHLLRRQRRRHGAGLGGGPRRCGTARWNYRLKPFHLQERVVLRQPVPVLVEPEQAVLLAGQPRAERHPGLLLRQQLARPPAAGADRLHRGGRQLPASTSRARQGRRTPSTPRPTTAPTPTPGCPTATTSTTPTWPRPPDGRRRRCRCTCSTSRARRTRTVTRSRRPTSATRPTPSTTSTPTACPTGWSSTPTASLDARRRPSRRDGRGVERLVRHGLPGRPGPAEGPAGQGRRRALPVRRRGRRPRPHRADRLQGRRQRGPCTGGNTGHTGGYTYADYGQVGGGPEVHADGEIWAQTLWDLRDALGSTDHRVAGDPGDGALAEQPVVPRHAQRDPARRHRRSTAAGDQDAIWKVFAHRGMGYFAGSLRRQRHRTGRGLRTRRRPGTRPARSRAP